jgi:hypothetical protein
MTVATISPRIEYLENGVTTTFNIPFQFLAAADIVVTSIDELGAETVLHAGYAIVGGDGETGQLIKDAAGVDGSTLRIERYTPRAQQTDYQQNGEFPAESHERALDRSMMIDQEQDARILDPDAIRELIAALLHPGSGISITYDPDAKLITIANTFGAEFIRDTIAATLDGGPGVTITADDLLDKIHISVPALTELAGCVKLSGDAGGATGGIGGVGGPSGEAIVDLIASVLVAGTGMQIVYNDAGDQITFNNLASYTDEQARDAIGAALVAGSRISITVNDAGDQITIASDALAPDYAGIVPIVEAGAFNFDDTMCGRGILYTGGAAAATIRNQAVHALRSGWVVTIRNKGTGPLTIALGGAVLLYVNGAGAPAANATIAQGGWATLQRWGADDLTIAGPGVS